MKQTTSALIGLAAIAVLAGLVVLAGCSGGFGPTFPSPDSGMLVGQLCGTVMTSDEVPIADAHVYIGVQQGSEGPERIETDETGRFCVSDLEPGNYALTAGAEGYGTEYRVINVTGQNQTEDVVMNEPVADNPADCPVITAAAGEVDQVVGTVDITGTVTNTDADTVAIFQDGDPALSGLEDMQPVAVVMGPRSFDHVAFLHPGTNVFRVLASNAACTAISDPITVEWTPPAGSDFYFRVTLSWDTPTSDPDLHTWSPDPDDEHSAYWNRPINAGQLDRDDTEGFGPENFTCNQLAPGRFRIAVNSYSLDQDDHSSCTVRVVTGGLADNSIVRTFGPHTFSAANGEDGYPVTGDTDCWWRPVDIELGPNGEVTLLEPDRTALVRNPSGTPAQAAAADSAK